MAQPALDRPTQNVCRNGGSLAQADRALTRDDRRVNVGIPTRRIELRSVAVTLGTAAGGKSGDVSIKPSEAFSPARLQWLRRPLAGVEKRRVRMIRIDETRKCEAHRQAVLCGHLARLQYPDCCPVLR